MLTLVHVAEYAHVACQLDNRLVPGATRLSEKPFPNSAPSTSESLLIPCTPHGHLCRQKSSSCSIRANMDKPNEWNTCLSTTLAMPHQQRRAWARAGRSHLRPSPRRKKGRRCDCLVLPFEPRVAVLAHFRHLLREYHHYPGPLPPSSFQTGSGTCFFCAACCTTMQRDGRGVLS